MGFPGSKKKKSEVIEIVPKKSTLVTGEHIPKPLTATQVLSIPKKAVLDFLENNLKTCEKAIVDLQEKLGKAEKDSVLRGAIIAQINHELTGKTAIVVQIQLQQ